MPLMQPPEPCQAFGAATLSALAGVDRGPAASTRAPGRSTFRGMYPSSMAMMKRTIIKQEIEKHNARLSSSISKNTDFLILGENPGNKFTKAKEMNIKIINEKEFLIMLENS